MMQANLDGWFSIADAARQLGVNERTIRRRVKAGSLSRDSRKRVQLGATITALEARADARGRKMGRVRPKTPKWERENRQRLKRGRAYIASVKFPKKEGFALIQGVRGTFDMWKGNVEKKSGPIDKWPKLLRQQVMTEIEPIAQLFSLLKRSLE